MTASADPHPSREQLIALSGGNLVGDDAAAVESHVAECEVCTAALGQLTVMDGLVARLRWAVKTGPAEASPGDSLADGINAIRSFLEPSTFAGSHGRLGHYEILECLGQGGFGIVFRAFDDSLQRIVAVKVLAPALSTTSPPRKRFLREARIAAQVRDDHVVGIYAVEELPIPYLVMEYIPGETLDERLDRIGPLEVPEVRRLGCQIARGLTAAHKLGLIHRDIKPGNILLEQGIEERVKISDFGLARAVDDAQLTQSGFIAGTPMFMAPEQARGDSIDQRADLFSLGSVLYTMVTGRPPFRASNTIAVLKRVCEDVPRPLRELIPETPQWLCDIITRLHAKDPAERFQNAGEVADLLGKGSEQIEQQSASGSPGTASRLPARGTQANRSGQNRLWVAAAVLFCLFGTLGLSEATGVTRIADSVIRILTPGGTLVVETGDRNVRVTVEGDGGLVIKGAGLEEIRLRPGSYKVQAERDGARIPLERELVSIATGGREVVRVKLETSPSRSGVGAETSAFVLLGGKGVNERKFDTLSEAVTHASSGDTIEVRGNGPFFTDPIRITDCDLTIRAAEGYRPVIRLRARTADAPANESRLALLLTNARLVLEGLEMRRPMDLEGEAGFSESHVHAQGPALYVANCRFLSDSPGSVPHQCLIANGPSCTIRNSEFLFAAEVAVQPTERAKLLTLENCLHLGHLLCHWHQVETHTGTTLVKLSHNTFVTDRSQALMLHRDSASWGADDTDTSITVDATRNIMDVDHLVLMQFEGHDAPDAAKAEAALKRFLHWKGEENLYKPMRCYAAWLNGMVELPIPGPQNLAKWREFWTIGEDGSAEGSPHYQGGQLVSRVPAALDTLTPDDFRLRPDSVGYRAGKGGTDLGADVDLVGPGLAYERWKKTPDYQEWLKDIAKKPDAPQSASPVASEKNAFVLLGGPGINERRFDTLSEATSHASSGDTIEVHGNGPFPTDPIQITNCDLTIRAAPGHRPVIHLNVPGRDAHGDPLFESNARLVLEGLELIRTVDADTATAYPACFVHASGAALHLANCRWRSNAADDIPRVCIIADVPSCHIRNCEFLQASHVAVVAQALNSHARMHNCLYLGGMVCDWHDVGARQRAGLVELNHNTIVTDCQALMLYSLSTAWTGSDEVAAMTMDAAGNIIAAADILQLQCVTTVVPAKEQAEATLKALLHWRGRENLYQHGGRYMGWFNVSAGLPIPSDGLPIPSPQNLESWREFWNSKEEGSHEDSPRFHGGYLLGRTPSALDTLTPDDFRLRPDSIGYRAGKDGKDLGADVDLVGPGPAYERWKKTPDYQVWLQQIAEKPETNN